MAKPTQKDKPKPVFEKFLPYLFFVFLGFCIADLLVLNFRDLMLPNQPPPARPKRSGLQNENNRGAYNSIISRNIFSADGTIPEPLIAEGSKQKRPEDMPPVPSQLPLGLVGTIVHSNPEKSIANIELRSKNTVLAYTINREIDKIATLTKIERNKVFLKNLNNNQNEYLEMKSTSKLSFSGSKPAAAEVPKGSTEVKQTAPNKFELKRADVLKYTENMASVLQQAAMAPKRGANGEIEGFKFLSIQPGSIYTQLGFQNGDVIKGVNGEAVDSPAKAMELYNTLKSSNNIKIKVERDGRDTDFDYNVN
jgi:general secretion pathway protein C